MLSEKGKKVFGGLHSPMGPLTHGLGRKERGGIATLNLGCITWFCSSMGPGSTFARENCPNTIGFWSKGNSGSVKPEDRHLHLADGESEAQASQAMKVVVLTHLLEGELVQAFKE